MRSRLLTLLLIAVLTMSFVACSKKNQTQNAPAGDNSTAAQSQSATTGQPPAQQNPSGQPMAPAQESAQTTQSPPPPLVVPDGTHIVIRGK